MSVWWWEIPMPIGSASKHASRSRVSGRHMSTKHIWRYVRLLRPPTTQPSARKTVHRKLALCVPYRHHTFKVHGYIGIRVPLSSALRTWWIARFPRTKVVHLMAMRRQVSCTVAIRRFTHISAIWIGRHLRHPRLASSSSIAYIWIKDSTSRLYKPRRSLHAEHIHSLGEWIEMWEIYHIVSMRKSAKDDLRQNENCVCTLMVKLIEHSLHTIW